ncbi:hypothetical protein RCL1_006966 [Eukaryota sp. TZLM3-RCL]
MNATVRLGWLFNFQQNSIVDPELGSVSSSVACYFVSDTGETFCVDVPFQPYFYIELVSEFNEQPSSGALAEAESVLRRRLDNIAKIETILKEDLQKPNHLTQKGFTFLKVSFNNVSDHSNAIREVNKIIHNEVVGLLNTPIKRIREYDVPYLMRATIDLNLRVGLWYSVTYHVGSPVPKIERREDLIERSQLRVLAYDIECTKQPLKFPDSQSDVVMMISFMIDGHGVLIVNREVVAEDIQEFDFSPTLEFSGFFKIFNEPDEYNLIKRFFDYIKLEKPHVIVTYNGDFFDFPFVEGRAQRLGLNMESEIGFANHGTGLNREFLSKSIIHMDCFYWVKRDSYLPQGSHGLKAVTKAKLGFDPYEIDPELMTPYARERPQYLASYSVSDAVSTYYLYMKYVHPFIFSLCNIVPYSPDDVLRKGSGSLCESLLLAQAFHDNIVAPDKQLDHGLKIAADGKIIDTETYVGARVESLTSGIFRKDLPENFTIDTSSVQKLIDKLKNDLEFALTTEGQISLNDVTNFDDVYNQIHEKLVDLQSRPLRSEPPLIYHLDVGAMYPNIILTNRLQPCSIVTPEHCAACDFYKKDVDCRREMNWTWRGEVFPLKKNDYLTARQQLLREDPNFESKSDQDKVGIIRKRLSLMSRKVHTSIHDTIEEVKSATICQKENPFYVDTVRAFRDRRYEYKAKQKEWKGKLETATSSVEKDKVKNMIIIFDSLQLAHKCILNSFYGYVMRAGSRWHSIEMAGVVTSTGVDIITQARKLIEKIGRPLELDTDGIWLIFPQSFPENFDFKLKNGKKYSISYPCVMLNADVFSSFTNHQYYEQLKGSDGLPLYDPQGLPRYKKVSECSIFFEVDGPYRAMVLPSSTDEGRMLKKRYAVFDNDGRIAELKGFELKRRGELQLIKQFQQEVFQYFLKGDSLVECYQAVGAVANNWLNILHSQGESLHDDDVIELLSESKNMSKSLAEYGDQKSVAITTAKKLKEFLGDSIVEDANFVCKFFISKFPAGTPVNERAVPISIFSADPNIQLNFLRRWCGSLDAYDIKNLIDWSYYIERFEATVRKIITIPAALQNVPNPCPLVAHPPWLEKMLKNNLKAKDQPNIKDFFSGMEKRKRLAQNDDVMEVRIRSDDESDEESTVPRDDDVITVDRSPPPAPVEKLPLKRQNNPELWLKICKKNWSLNLAKKRARRELFRKAKIEIPIAGFQSKKIVSRFEREAHSILSTSFSSLSSPSSFSKAPLSPLVHHSTSMFGHSIEETLANNDWFILSIIQSNEPGFYYLWAIVNNSLQCVSLNIPRIFYLETRNQNVDYDWIQSRKVSKVPPSEEKTRQMIEIFVEESSFIENFDEILALKYLPDTSGIYELDVPLIFRALVMMTCQVKVSQMTRQSLISGGKKVGSVFNLKEFEPVKNNQSNIDSTFFDSIPTLFVVAISINRRTVVCAFSSRFRKLVMVNVHPAFRSVTSPLSKSDLLSQSATFSDWSVAFHLSSSLEAAFSIIDSLVDQESNHNRGQDFSFMIKQGDLLSNRWNSSGYLPSMILSSSVDQSKMIGKSNQMSWIATSLSVVVSEYLGHKSKFLSALDFSKVVSIPVGNLAKDSIVQAMDVLFARQLVEDNQILWTNDVTNSELQSKKHVIRSKLVENEPYFEKGVFRSIVCELKMYFFAANSVVSQNSSVGTSLLTVLDHVKEIPQVLKFSKFILTCRGRAHAKNIPNDDMSLQIFGEILKSVFRYVTSSRSSLLYSPELAHKVESLCSSSLSSLISSMKRMGARVVYADYSVLKICTKKFDLSTAIDYINAVTDNLRCTPQFSFLKFYPLNFCNTYLILDKTNYLGLYEFLPDNPDANVKNVPTGYLMIANQPVYSSIYKDVLNILAQYLILSQKLTDLVLNYESTGEPVGNYFKPEEVLKLVKNFEDFDHKLLVASLRGMFLGQYEGSEFNFERYFLSAATSLYNNKSKKSSLTDDCLNFVNFVCFMLELDPAIESIISHFRENILLKIYNTVSQVEQSFDFPSLVVNNLPCPECRVCSTVDLCREQWNCKDCRSPLDDVAIEGELVELLSNFLVSYQTQEFSCEHCKLSAQWLLPSLCSCGGKLDMSVNGNFVQDFIKPFKSILSLKGEESFVYLQEILDLFI